MRHILSARFGLIALLTVALAATQLTGCHPSATVERTTPVANLRFYRSVALRVSAAPGTQSQAGALEIALISRLQQQCNFDRVVRGGQNAGTDLVIDLNILRAARGGSGIIQNQNQAMLDALLVLSDGVNGDLLGSARIHGKSSAVLMTSGPSPEVQAVNVVAKSVGDLLGKSGCSGARVARPTPATDTGTRVAQGSTGRGGDTSVGNGGGNSGGGSSGGNNGSDSGAGDQGGSADSNTGTGTATDTPPPGTDHKAEAEALNESGKKKFRTADIAGALADFQQASNLSPDPRYAFNICLAHEALEEWDQALSACGQAQGMSPDGPLAQKIGERIDIIQQRKAGK